MNYINILQNSLDYIEDNIKTTISPEELAALSGFSVFHYYRIFQAALGRSVMEYITRRRLLHALYDMSQGDKKIEVALLYGFNTYAGFYKAFIKEFKSSPSRYLDNHTVSRPYKINLIKEEYIMLSHKKLKQVLLKWNLNDVELKNIYYEANGIIQENKWYVNDDYILSVGTNMEGLKHHIQISKELNKKGLNASLPIPTKDGMDYYVEEDIYYYLATKLEGEAIKSGECYKEDYSKKAFSMGEMIGNLHQILLTYDDTILCNEPNLYKTCTEWAIPKTKEILNLPEEFYIDYQNQFSELFPLLPKQIIHRDPNPGNIIVKDGKLSGFIDFDLTEKNVRLFDPCYLSTAILSESFVEDDKDKLNKWSMIFKQILSGYDSLIPLSKEEKAAIPYIILSIQFIFIAYLEGKEKLTAMFETNKKMTLWLANNKEILRI